MQDGRERHGEDEERVVERHVDSEVEKEAWKKCGRGRDGEDTKRERCRGEIRVDVAKWNRRGVEDVPEMQDGRASIL